MLSIQFFVFLLAIDSILARKVQSEGCPKCGSQLDVSNYERKPRGLEDSSSSVVHYRFSYCCRKDGCRKRVTPPSVRFLGRKVYVGVVLILAMSREWIEKTTLVICRQTLGRWKEFWRTVLKISNWFWKNAKGSLPVWVQPTGSPIPILEIFRERHANVGVALSKCLEFFSPLSIAVPSG